MSKPMVEKYEQILAQDPASTVFVELAKALIEKGQHARAIEVCKTGLGHHRDSVVGRVLWGKALIDLGRPAEAMEQFDQATSVDRDNPHAYNLIGEVLLHKGLYRSALPLLKKAMALQPNDGRVRQWLEQTQRALAGGPAPVLVDVTAVGAPDPDSLTTHPGVTAGRAPGTMEPEVATEVDVAAYVPGAEARPAPVIAAPPLEPTVSSGAAPQAVAPDPFDEVAARSSANDTIGGLSDTFEALTAEAPKQGEGEAAAVTLPEGAAPASPSEAALSPAPTAEAPGLLDIPSGPIESGALGESPVSSAPARELSGPISALLGEIPDALDPSSSVEVPKVEVSPHAAEAIAKEYERELREKLAAASSKKGLLQRHGGKLAVAAVLTLVASVGGGVFVYTRHKHSGRDVATLVGDAKRAIALDTRASYRLALESLKVAAEMDEGAVDPWALSAYAQAILFAEHGGSSEDKLAALSALARRGVRDSAPGLSLIGDLYLADAKAREEAKKVLLASSLDETEVQAVAGKLLLADRKADEGVKRLSRAVGLLPSNVRALVALGGYYRDFGDHEKALEVYALALQHSRQHPEAALGVAEARLELGRDLADSLKELEALTAGGETSLPGRRELVRGRLLSELGRGAEAVGVLAAGSKQYPPLAFDFSMALGEASRAVGQMQAAQLAFEAALKARPKSDEAKEGLGRVLIARDREKDVLARLVADGEGARKVFLVRGIAAAHLGEWRRARQELSRTGVNGKFPSEAVVYLALADAAEGQSDKAQEVLEKALIASKKAKAEARVALGRVYWQRGALDKAKVEFEAAAAEPQDVEGSCSLGRLLQSLGLPELALEPLSKAVANNGSHGEARHALGRAQLAIGKTGEGLAQAEAWIQDNPQSAAAHRDLAFAQLLAGKLKEAEVASAQAVKLEGGDAEAFRVRARVLFAKGDPKQALVALERANKLDPQDSQTFCEIGAAFLRAGNAANALRAYEAAVREEPKSTCGQVGRHLARLPSVQKGAAKELGELSKLARNPWDRSFAQATLSRVLLAGGTAKEARKAAEEAVAHSPFSGGAQLAVGLAALRLKDESAANKALTRAVELDPAHGAIRLARAELLEKGGPEELKSAVEEYEAFLRIGGPAVEVARVRKGLFTLKKRLGQR